MFDNPTDFLKIGKYLSKIINSSISIHHFQSMIPAETNVGPNIFSSSKSVPSSHLSSNRFSPATPSDEIICFMIFTRYPKFYFFVRSTVYHSTPSMDN